MSDDQKDPEVEMVKNKVLELAEHFDSVQIFATRFDADTKDTATIQIGTGNFTARFGQITEWCERILEQNRCKAREEYNIQDEDNC